MSASEVVARYGAAAAAGDMTALAATLAPDVRWNQPGTNQLSGTYDGPEAVVAHLGNFMALSQGTFRLETQAVTEAGDLVATTVRFSAELPDRAALDQRGVDVFRVSDGQIAEVWLISEDQAAEDAFWG